MNDQQARTGHTFGWASLHLWKSLTSESGFVTIPNHLNKTDDLRPAIRKILVDEARRYNRATYAENAKGIRESVAHNRGRDDEWLNKIKADVWDEAMDSIDDRWYVTPNPYRPENN